MDWRPAEYLFHSAIHHTCGNPLFGQLIRQIQQGFHEVYQTPFDQPELGQETTPIHPPLAEAVVSRNETEAVCIIEAIMDMVGAEIRHGVEIRKVPVELRQSKAAGAAATLGLSALTARLPKALSGGRRQLVAMERATIRPN